MIKLKQYVVPLTFVVDIQSWNHGLHSNAEKDWVCFDNARNDPAFKNRYSQSYAIDVLKICKDGNGDYNFFFIEFKDLTKVGSATLFFIKKRDNLIMKLIESIAITSYFLGSSRYVGVKDFLLSKKRRYYIVYNGGNKLHSHLAAIVFLKGIRLSGHVSRVDVMEWSVFCKIISPTCCK
ncbi:hypothetical protein HF292_013835 [Acidithiobacillus ferruginosus]|uniref:Uncharacterized protein n=2 Tax=Acidithiobacillus TaxID=119977 RepID=A0A7T5BH88_9PROT|nr:hypothetical protein [Acidithiobacillus ferrivorans]QQD72353.1 hypothetical protein H2515_13275 [Acidithiobacillus ferrivorans]